MKLLIDIGNSNICVAIAGDKIEKTFRYKTLKNRTDDELYLIYKPLFDIYKIDSAIISSVVPVLTSAFSKMIKKYLDIDALIIGPGIKTGISVKADDPKIVGADLICDCAGAMKFYDESIIVDLGTATKFIYCKNNVFYGCAIAPGVALSLNALVNGAELLHSIELQAPKKVLGTNTCNSMLSGIIYTNSCAIDGIVKKIRIEVGNPNIPVIATGGLSKLIIPSCEETILLEENLTLIGLLEIYNKNV